MTQQEIFKDPRFEYYFKLLTEVNEKFNLTSITNKNEVYLKHFYDSILPLNLDVVPPLFAQGAKVLDVGSGAGFPGICLKLARPDLDITLVESIGKKVSFLQSVLTDLKLTNIRAIKTRIEDFKQRNFDVTVARAVAPLGVLAEYCLPFLRIGGQAVFYKSSAPQSEIDSSLHAVSFLGGVVEKILFAPLNDEILRSFVVIKKIKSTPFGYPRGGNKPRNNPL